MENVFRTKKIKYTGVIGEGTASISMVTSDIAEAMKGADIVIVAVPAFAHKNYAEKLPPYYEDGQTVVVFAGVFGSLVFWNELKKAGCNKDVKFAETYTLPYATRLAKPGQSVIFTLTNPILTGVMPAKHTDEVMATLAPLYPVKPAKSVLDSGLYNINPVTHVPGCILNAGRIERQQGDFYFYREAIPAGVGRITEMLDAERMAIARKLGYSPTSIVDSLKAAGGEGANISDIISNNPQWAKIQGPEGYQNRYFTEDIPFGLVGWAGVAQAISVATPIMSSLVTLSSGLMQQDCWKVGRQLSEMGLAGKNIDQIQHYLLTGEDLP